MKVRTDNSKPKKYDKEGRVISKDTMPPGKNTCNGKLSSRDGYCKLPGVANFHRCKYHGGKNTQNALEVFNKSIGFKNALKLKALLDDTLSMDNELASAKVLYTAALEDWQRARYVLQEYVDNMPEKPDLDADPIHFDVYNNALELHNRVLKWAQNQEDRTYKRVQNLTKTLTEGVAKNVRIKEGNKFTMDIRQIRDIIKIQLEVMAANCSGCDRLKVVISMMKDKMRDMPIDVNLSKANKKAMGAKKYREQLEMIEKVGDMVQEGNFEDI